MKEHERIYFLKHRKEIQSAGYMASKSEHSFEFELEANIAGEKLVESYVGVDFSVIYEVEIIILKGARVIQGKEVVYVTVGGQGIKPDIGKSEQPTDFTIDSSSLDGSSITSVPKFMFSGRITSTN